MTARVGRLTALRVFARSFLVQGSWNYHTMIGSGFCYSILPGLRRLFGDRPDELERAVRRHIEHFNAHPYLSDVALGATLKMEEDGVDDQLVRRFKAAVRGPLGSLGDTLVWATWLPAVSLASLSLYWWGAAPWTVVLTFLAVYNLGHLGLRAWGFRVGLRDGREVGKSLQAADLASWADRLRVPAAALIGLVLGALVSTEGGLASAGLGWLLLGGLSFVAGWRVGHRLWRPAAVATVVAVGVGTAVGMLS